MITEKGQTLLEVLLALSASVVILSAITVVVISSLNNAQFTKNQNLANQYAQEGMEVVRKIRSSGGWTGFLALNNPNNYCLAQSPTNLTVRNPVTGCGQNVGIFVREININHNNVTDCPPGPTPPPTLPNGSRVASKVSWSDSKCAAGNPYCHKVELVSCLYNID